MDNENLKPGEYIYFRSGDSIKVGKILILDSEITKDYIVKLPEVNSIPCKVNINNISRKRSELEQPVLV